MGDRRRERNNNWRGGRIVSSNGYVLVRVGVGHPLADVRGYAYEHRVVASELVGRTLSFHDVVHHIDGNKQNNAPDNLVVTTHIEHRMLHRARDCGRRMPNEHNCAVTCACGCGAEFLQFDTCGRPRRFVSGHNTRMRA